MSNDSLSSLLGSYDNLGEPVPTANKRETVLGVTIVFMVRDAQASSDIRHVKDY